MTGASRSLLCWPARLRCHRRSTQPPSPMSSQLSAVAATITMDGPTGWPPTASMPPTRTNVDWTSRRASTATDTPGSATRQTTSATGQTTAALQPGTAAMQPKLATSRGKMGEGMGPIEPECPQQRRHQRQALQRQCSAPWTDSPHGKMYTQNKRHLDRQGNEETHTKCARRNRAENTRAHPLTHMTHCPHPAARTPQGRCRRCLADPKPQQLTWERCRQQHVR